MPLPRNFETLNSSMPVDLPFDIYKDHLSSLYLGRALWNPSPHGCSYDHVSIGDVGYEYNGTFLRLFNVMVPWNDQSNRTLGVPDHYQPLTFDNLTIRHETFGPRDYYSRLVSKEENAYNLQAASPDEWVIILSWVALLDLDSRRADVIVTYRCEGRGALLCLPNGGHREDVISTKAFGDYIRDHADRWFKWAQEKQLSVERMEDLVLVSGCSFVTSWACAAFVDHTINAEISLERRRLSNGGTKFVWSNIQGPVAHHNSLCDPVCTPACVYLTCIYLFFVIM